MATTPEVLQRYLTAGIECEATDNLPYLRKGERGQLVGLNMQQSPNKVGLLVEGKAVYWQYPGDLLPVLRPFSQLVEPLPDGTIPAVEVAKIVLGCPQIYERTIDFPSNGVAIRRGQVDVSFFVVSRRAANVGCGDVTITPAFDIEVAEETGELLHGNLLAAYDYLRSHLFAVGLAPHEFIVKGASNE